MENIITAEELTRTILDACKLDVDAIEDNDPEFIPYIADLINNRTKEHVVAALYAASYKAEVSGGGLLSRTTSRNKAYVDTDSILNAYPLDLIK